MGYSVGLVLGWGLVCWLGVGWLRLRWVQWLGFGIDRVGWVVVWFQGLVSLGWFCLTWMV